MEPILPLAVSLALGLLIGLERGWHEREAGEGRRVAGVRTYALMGLLGGFAGLLATETHYAVLGFAFVGVAAALVAGYVFSARQSGDLGVTSLIAGLLTFAFGAAATIGYMAEAAMAAPVAGFPPIRISGTSTTSRRRRDSPPPCSRRTSARRPKSADSRSGTRKPFRPPRSTPTPSKSPSTPGTTSRGHRTAPAGGWS